MGNNQMNQFSRRDFIKVSSISSSGLLLANNVMGAAMRESVKNSGRKTKYAFVGVGHRSETFQKAIFGPYSEHAEIVGFCDINEGRLNLYRDDALRNYNCKVPVYFAKDFDKMVRKEKPDTVIVTTIDSTHDEYIIRAMELGCNVITEKPMTTTHEKCQAIIEAQKRTGREIIVGFNYRYSPPRTQVKDLLMNNVIGDVLSVDFHWMLNTHHGADYFRRWHSMKQYSGGLMVHKATHHFDLVNWWLSAIPVEVQANGKRDFYTPQIAKRFGLTSHHERCFNCPEKDKCGFSLDLSKNPRLKRLYLDNEGYDGYFRDRCVFRPEIDIEDTMNVIVKYNTKATLCYSLNAFNSWEGYFIVFNGTKGRIEHKMEEKVYISGDGNVQGGVKEGETFIQVIPLRGEAYKVEVKEAKGGHGGGDDNILHDIFVPGERHDKYFRCADQRAGAYSILTGIAANRSIETGNKVLISDLVSGIGMPDYTPMPDHEHSLPMPG